MNITAQLSSKSASSVGRCDQQNVRIVNFDANANFYAQFAVYFSTKLVDSDELGPYIRTNRCFLLVLGLDSRIAHHVVNI